MLNKYNTVVETQLLKSDFRVFIDYNNLTNILVFRCCYYLLIE